METALRKHAWSNRAEQWRACENKNPARVARAAARHVVKKLADWFFHGIAELWRASSPPADVPSPAGSEVAYTTGWFTMLS